MLDDPNPESVAILAMPAVEANLISEALGQAGLASVVCADLDGFVTQIPRSGLAVITEASVDSADLYDLSTLVAAQSDWSDFPFILLTSPPGDGSGRNTEAERLMRTLGNVTVLEWPFHPMTFVSIARTGLASRRRQYQLRDRMEALERSRAAIAEGDERLKFAVAAGRLGFWELTFPERGLIASPLCKTNLGLAPDAPLDYDGLIAIVDPEDRARLLDAAQQAIDGHGDYIVACRITGGGARQRWAEIRGRATYDGERPTGMVGLCLDITERKEAEERQNLLIRELHHRVKNTLSTVQAIVGATARGATSIDQFYHDFTGRIISLANTHTILTEEYWQKASIHELLAKELDLYDSGSERVRVNGPALELPSGFAVPLGMAFHELTTNAAKYGALANGQGYVAIDWTVEPEAAARRVRIAWTEHDGPPVALPTRQGFGTRLLQRILTAQMNAEVGIDYDPGGLRVSVSFPLPDALPGKGPGGAG
jgi:PAS domain S-box-containing protein